MRVGGKMDKSTSYSSSNIYPSKVLKAKELCVSNFGFIHPIHVQLCPTNICNLNCPFCSCSKREKTQELSMVQMKKIICDFNELGTKAVTITGGGEPCCYKDLGQILQLLSDLGISSGMVSNGLLLEKHKYSLPLLTWCRVSASDDRDIDQLISVLQKIIPSVRIDWAISYVLTAKFDEPT
jgi:wyosine [tRNA(Phe)-imidazoG37] synthetase (radical SAM superfamily)